LRRAYDSNFFAFLTGHAFVVFSKLKNASLVHTILRKCYSVFLDGDSLRISPKSVKGAVKQTYLKRIASGDANLFCLQAQSMTENCVVFSLVAVTTCADFH